MKRLAFASILLVLLFALALSCDKDGSEGDEDLAPVLYQDSFMIHPNPATLYEKALFYFAFTDHDGDMKNPSLTLTYEVKENERQTVAVDKIHVEGETSGSLWFELEIYDGYEGTYYITVTDESGRVSNEIEIALFVN